MKKFGFAVIVASGLAASFVGVASPIQSTALADAIPVISLPGYTSESDHQQWIDAIQPPVNVAPVGMAVHQSR